MAEAGLLAVFFRLLNLFIVISLLIFIYVKYVLPGIKDAISLDKLRIINLKNAFVDNNRNIDQLKNNYIIEEARLEDLNNKVQKWKDISLQEDNKHAKENRLILDVVAKKRLEQSLNLSNLILEKEIAIKAISAAEKELKKAFDESAQLDYIKKIGIFIKSELNGEQ